MKTTLDFEKEDTKNLLAKLDFGFFLEMNINDHTYNRNDIDIIYSEFEKTKQLIKTKSKENKKQYNYFTEVQVRKMFTGGLLPSTFGLNESRGYTIMDFKSTGENWAYFDHWQKYQKHKITKAKIWDFTVKTGSILAIILSIIKFLELINQYNGNN